MTPSLAAEGKERLGLKDLARLAAEQSGSKVEFKPVEKPVETPKPDDRAEKGNNKKKGKKNRKKNHKNKGSHASPAPVSSPVSNNMETANHEARTTNSTPVSTSVITPVKPEVEYQEKSTVQIQPSHKPIELNMPIRGADKFADKDNSMDGIISIKH